MIEEEGTGRHILEKRKEHRKNSVSTFQLLSFYSVRLIGTGGNWFLVDIVFYGLKLFSGPIFSAINPQSDLIFRNGYLLLYNLIGLLGYYCSAYVIDTPAVGRKRLQLASFVMLTILFCFTAAFFNTAPPGVLMTLYFFSKFFSNFGANTTTYVMAAETYPTELRGTCHGLSAFSGKFGALVATIVFGMIEDVSVIFWICAGVSIVGSVFTIIFSCDLTKVSLVEHDAQLELFMDGRLDEYKGLLNAPQHLSNYELWVGRHGEYDPHWANKFVIEEEKSGVEAK